MSRPEAGRCRSCGARIWWIRTPAGKRMPVEHERIVVRPSDGTSAGATYETVVTAQGEVVRGVRVAAQWDPGRGRERDAGLVAGGRSHFATCPNAERHRGVGRGS